MTYTLGASILAADWSKLGEELRDLESSGIDYIHWDAMDNRFVPNLTFGWELIADCRKSTTLPFEAHLMTHEPSRDVEKYAEAGVDRLIVQPESALHIHETLMRINSTGMKTGVAINPGTSLESIEELMPQIETLLIMTVNPGFGGQDFIETLHGKIQAARQWIDAEYPDIRLEVDGGLKPHNVARAVDSGARAVVCGSGLFGSEGKEAAITAMKNKMAATANGGEL